jgi:predicted regulator of Ras-like GTPase activity (Roadblock/LC7/MglB family)
MPSIRDVVRTLAVRDGVDAVIVLGRDGLTIDSSVKDGVDPDGLAALIPSVVAACTQLGLAASRGEFGLGAVEYAGGVALICALTPESLLAVFVKSNVNVGSLLYELHRHRSAIASLLQ